MGAISHTADFSPPTHIALDTQSQVPKSSLRFHFNVGSNYHYPKSQNSAKHTAFSTIKSPLLPPTSHSAFDDPAPSADHPSTHPDVPDGLLEFTSFASTLETENTANFAAAMERPPAFWNHATSNAEHDALPPPYGYGHIIGPPLKIVPATTIIKEKWNDHITNSGFHSQKKETPNTTRCSFAVDTMCSPISVISEAMVKQLNLKTRSKTVVTSLADTE